MASFEKIENLINSIPQAISVSEFLNKYRPNGSTDANEIDAIIDAFDYYGGKMWLSGNTLISEAQAWSNWMTTVKAALNDDSRSTKSAYVPITDTSVTRTTDSIKDADTSTMAKIRNNISSVKDTDMIDTFKISSSKRRDSIIHKSLNIQGDYDDDGGAEDRKSLTKNIYTLFDRYYSIYPDTELSGLCHYVFMTRPDLNLLNINSQGDISGVLSKVMAANPAIKPIWDSNKEVLKSLTSHLSAAHEFAPIITTRAEGLQLPDYSIKSYSLRQPYTAYTMPYASHGIASTTGGTFNLTLRETADLSLHKLFNTWLTYINDINLGKCDVNSNYIKENRCDYMVSFYDIICAPDAKTILFWVKYVGCMPTVVENSTLSFNLRGGADNMISIPFDYFLAETMNYYSLIDFNKNAGYDINGDDDLETLLLSSWSGDDFDILNIKGNEYAGYGTTFGLYNKPIILPSGSNRPFPQLCWIR